jgi:drug/metabolite transporter (DMT)-like permease
MSNISSSLIFVKGRAVGAMILSSACWGLATVMSKAALGSVPPLHLLAIQLASSITFLWAIALLIKRYPAWKWQTFRYSLTGILEPGFAYIFGMLGLVITTASNASLIGTTEPILIIAISWIFLREKVTKLFLLFTGFALAGVILIISQDLNLLKVDYQSLLGDFLIFVGTFCAALYVVVSHQIVESDRSLSPLSLAAIQQTGGFILVTLVWWTGILGREVMNLSALNISVWILAIASGIVQYALAFWFYLIALREITAGTAALFLTLIPVFGVGGAYLFLHEQLTLWQWLGAILIVTAVSSITWQQK